MSNLFKKTDAATEIEEDRVGGGSFVLETDIYPAVIKTVYMSKAANSDAQSVNFIFEVDNNGTKQELRQQFWVMNKTGGVTYKDKKTKETKNLPSYNLVNGAAMLLLGSELGDLDLEPMTVKLYDFDSKKELPQEVQCFTEFHKMEVQIAVQKQNVDKTAKDDSTGQYEPTGETRDQNEVIKFFPLDSLVTISEVSQQIKHLGGTLSDVLEADEMAQVIDSMEVEVGAYAETWLEKNKGKTREMAKGAGKSEGKSLGGGSKPAKKKAGLFD